ncbi:alpha/beta hydrolase [Pedobacter sp. MW01-1-1]|uniref:alpha/beta hydrolase n=1 Tax=Pedobacter sp. MW01-1-1 TaxID=3383027 RepID=UPI003FED5510
MMLKGKLFILWGLAVQSFAMLAQERIPLYAAEIPLAKKLTVSVQDEFSKGVYSRVISPSVEIYLPTKEKATGTAVLICPGGGYSVLVYDGEGVATAKLLAKNGIASFVLKYRLPNDSLQMDKSKAPLQDAQQAMFLIRKMAAKWNINPNKIGIMGFSAGGHVAASLATHYEEPLIPTGGISLRPDFHVLVYPVISMQDALTHDGSRRQLLGAEPSKEAIDYFSNEKWVNSDTPIAYLTHTTDDTVVDVDNSMVYFEQLRKNSVQVAMHIYPKGNHGFIFGHPSWTEPLFDWLKENNLMRK